MSADQHAAWNIAEDVMAGRRHTADPIADFIASREAAHAAAEGAALGEREPEPVTPEEPAEGRPRSALALVPGHGGEKPQRPDYDALVRSL